MTNVIPVKGFMTSDKTFFDNEPTANLHEAKCKARVVIKNNLYFKEKMTEEDIIRLVTNSADVFAELCTAQQAFHVWINEEDDKVDEEAQAKKAAEELEQATKGVKVDAKPHPKQNASEKKNASRTDRS